MYPIRVIRFLLEYIMLRFRESAPVALDSKLAVHGLYIIIIINITQVEYNPLNIV